MFQKLFAVSVAIGISLLAMVGETKAQQLDSPLLVGNDLRQIVLAYHQYIGQKSAAPSSAADLAPLLDKQALARLEKKTVVFIYGVSLNDLTHGMSETIIAYEKGAPEKGGSVAYVDGSVHRLSADEFKKAIIAKAPKK